MLQSPQDGFLGGTAGKKLPIRFEDKYDTPTRASPFYIDTSTYNYSFDDPNYLAHIHHGVEIETILSGNARLYIDGTYYDLHAGDCYFTNAMAPHMTAAASDAPISIIFAHINTSLIYSIPPPEIGLKILSLFYFPQKLINPVIRGKSRIGELLSEALTQFKDTNSIRKGIAWAKILEALVEMGMRVFAFSEKSENAMNTGTRTVIQTSIDFIHEHYFEPITIDQIAQSCNKSPSRYRHLFSEVMGYSPIDYRNKVRIDYALEQLLLTDKKIVTIANDCGFETLSNFNTIFKKITGHSPIYFRKTA